MQASSQKAGVDRPAQATHSIMKTIEVVLNAGGQSPASISALAKQVLASMTGNSNFQNPFPALPDVQTDVNSLDAAIVAAKDGGKTAMVQLRAATRQVVATLKALMAYVQYTSKGNEQAVLSSGFGLKKGRTPQAHVFTVTQGSLSGTAELSTKRESGQAAYLWQYTKDPIGSAPWTDVPMTLKAHQTVSGLTPLTTYWFRVAVLNKDGLQDWSDPYHLSVI